MSEGDDAGPTVRNDVAMEVSPRLTQWVNREFPEGSSERVLSELRDLPASVIGGQDPERIQAALVIGTGGDWQEFQGMLTLAHSDWRDLLVAADLGHDNWPRRLNKVLGRTGPRA
jgi:hypothetical protein